MTAAAASTPSNSRTSDLLEELEQILKQLDTLSSAAQEAVCAVIQSLLLESDLTATEVEHLNALLPRLSPPERNVLPAIGLAHRRSKRGTTRGIAVPSLSIAEPRA